jgi:hypothetical protein
MIQFNSDHAIQLRNSIASFQTIYREEWLDLIQDLQNLQQVWNDTHRFDFDQDFQNLASIHYQIEQELQKQVQEVDRTIEVIGKMKESLPNLDTSISEGMNSRTQTRPATFSNKNGSNQSQVTDSQESNSKLTEKDIQDWQKTWTDVSKSVTPFFNKMCALSTMSLSLFLGAMNSSPVAQVMKLSKQGLTSGIEFIVGDFQSVIDLNNETLGSEWSNLPDESIFKVISKITEDADNLHFGDEVIADIIGDFADQDEENKKRRRREQDVLNQLRSKYSQNANSK